MYRNTNEIDNTHNNKQLVGTAALRPPPTSTYTYGYT